MSENALPIQNYHKPRATPSGEETEGVHSLGNAPRVNTKLSPRFDLSDPVQGITGGLTNIPHTVLTTDNQYYCTHHHSPRLTTCRPPLVFHD